VVVPLKQGSSGRGCGAPTPMGCVLEDGAYNATHIVCRMPAGVGTGVKVRARQELLGACLWTPLLRCRFTGVISLLCFAFIA
jgi:hypothetical protein